MTLPLVIGKYEVHGVLGEGGMGVVYKGFDRAIARNVAIKAIAKAKLKPEEVKEVMGRFRHEAQAVGRLAHPRIIQIYDYGEDAQWAYIVMEMIQGKTLTQHLAAGDTYEVREAGEIVRQILDGIGHAHSAGVVHRDIKTSNILINSDGRIKISDFGIARTEASPLTLAGNVMGTLHYMAPEQFMGGPVDARADLYAIGVIAYELLTGRRPFAGDAPLMMQQVLNQMPENPSRVNPTLTPLVDRVLQQSLAKKPKDRFQNAREFSEALREAVEVNTTLSGAAAAVYKGDAVIPTDRFNTAALMNAARLLAPAARAGPMGAAGGETEFAAGDSAIRLDKSIKRARILFIDDEERILTALKSQFRERYHVFTTTEGEKALDFITRYQMHVIVSDQRMPNMVGVELLRRSREISPNSVRILLTGYSDLAAIVGSINDGEVYRFISKPWDNTDLQTIVAEAVTIALELADAKPLAVTGGGKAGAAPALPARVEAGILVVDQDEELFRVVRELMGAQCPVLYAASADDALAAMQKSEIAVVVTDVDFGEGQLTAMLKLLKQENPQILAIVATQASDSELVIELINQAQIFRFLNKPVNVKLVRGHMLAALERYLAYKATPQLLKAQKVAVVEDERQTSLAQRLLGGFKLLRGRWFGG